MKQKECLENIRIACCKRVAKWYIPEDPELERKVLRALLTDTDLKNTNHLFLEKKGKYDDCSPAFRRMLKVMDAIEKLPLFPDSWIRINLSSTELISVVRTHAVAPISLLTLETYRKELQVV